VASVDNASRNNLPAQSLPAALPSDVDWTIWESRADVVIANILAGPLLDLSAVLLRLMSPSATLLLAGLLESQAEALIGHYHEHVELQIVSQQDEWVCLRGQRCSV